MESILKANLQKQFLVQQKKRLEGLKFDCFWYNEILPQVYLTEKVYCEELRMSTSLQYKNLQEAEGQRKQQVKDVKEMKMFPTYQ